MQTLVALLAEGVDRNLKCGKRVQEIAESPSSQRAWIEILLSSDHLNAPAVALLAEGVDRNHKGETKMARFKCRPPRRGRG